MPYKLRPESKLKRPFWYQSDNDEDLDNASTSETSNAVPWNHNTEDSTDRIRSGVAHLRPGESSLTSPHHLAQQCSPTRKASQAETSNAARRSLDMANIKHVRPKRKVDATERSLEDIEHAARARLQSTQPPVELTALSIDSKAQPAAFPTLPTDQLTAGPAEQPDDHGLPRRMEAYKKCSQSSIERSERAVDTMYACTRFPENLSARQKEWYIELQKRWLPGEELVEDIEFTSLYPSLRATIIEQMYEAFPSGTWHDGYPPVRHLLQINSSTFQRIVEENAHVWETEEIPAHLLRLKQQNPGKAIDPDTPPQTGVVHAIRYLQQMHLPGSLLGEWQFPLPNIEAFIVPFELAVDVGSNTRINRTSSPIHCDDTDPDDEFEISLTESYIRRVVHTRPHTHKRHLHSAGGPQLLLPEYLERFARSQGIVRTAPPPTPSSPDPLSVSSTNPDIAIIAKSSRRKNLSATQPDFSLTSSSTPLHARPQSKLGFLSNSRAAMHADHLWAEHRFTHLDITTEPDYLSERPRNAHEAAIHLELCTLWKRDLARHMLRMEERHAVVAFSKEFKKMQRLVESLRRRIVQMQHVHLILKEGGSVEWSSASRLAMGLVQQSIGPRKDVSAQQHQQQQRGVNKDQRFERSSEPNCGFGPSTKVIPFRKNGEAASEKGDEMASEKGVVEAIELGVKHNVVPQTRKKQAVEVIDLKVPQGPVPQTKKRPAEVIDLDQVADVVPHTKKVKTTVSD